MTATVAMLEGPFFMLQRYPAATESVKAECLE
jgi:hypothetical protein